MLKPMKTNATNSRNIYLWALVGLLVLAGIIALIIAFSGGNNSEEEVNAVYTNAAATLAAQQLTLQASVPSSTPTTAVQTPTVTFTALASPTLFTSPVIASNTPGTTGGASGAVGCNNSAFVTDVTFPDYTVVNPGQTFTKTWKLSNTGSCPWTTTYKVSFVSGNAMGGTTTPLTVTVAPGASGDISVAMTAPATAGDAMGTWILTNDSGQNFGSTFYVLVKVGGTAVTGTAVTGTAVTGTPGTTTATSTSSVPTPVAANNPTITLDCAPNGAKYDYTGKLEWQDMSSNEQGFNIYVNGVLADIAPANTTSYKVQVNGRVTNVTYDAGTVITYSVEAFGAGGKAPQANVTGQCP